MRATLFTTCLGDHFFAPALRSTVRILERLGVTVDVPKGQTCCGQPALNAGYVEEARRIARQTVRALAGAPVVVAPSGSCAAMLRRSLPGVLEGDPLADEARALSRRVRELSELIVHDLGHPDLGRGLVGLRLAYHHGCHALRELGVRDEPVRLLRDAGADVVGWEAAEECCGFGGMFAVSLPVVSAAMADRKLDTLPEVDALVSADPGCLLQLGGRAGVREGSVPVRHLAKLLDEASDGAR